MPLPHRSETIRAYKERGGRVAAVLPIHYPRALLRAFDILPVEVWGPPHVDASYGAAHLQSYVCSIAHNALSFLLTGGLEVADVIIVPHACDSLQGLGSILIDFLRPRQPVFPIYLPRGQRDSDVRFLADEFCSLYRHLEEMTGRSPSEADLRACIQREEVADGLLAELHQRRSHLRLTQLDFYRLIRAREYLPAETFFHLARAALAQAATTPQHDGVSILLSGIVPEPMSLFEAIARLGGVVVADDLACCGRRLYPPGTSAGAFQRMAERILAAPPDPTRGSPIGDRLEYLWRLIQASGARGVVFYSVKFCEPELFDLPALRGGLQEVGVRSLTAEVDLNDPLSQRTLTGLEAFLEMIA
jgi:benzoyl-CoA reductase/2-hydroxyglutaryl-CoA dehydratase subunit BcrC/BadD/HgdB